MRPYTTYKAFGGVLAAIGLASALLIVLRDTPPGGGAPPPLIDAIVPGILGLLGLWVFVASDARLGDRGDRARPRVDVRSMAVAFGLLALYVAVVVVGAT